MILLLTAAAYYYFNWQYFLMAGKLRQMPVLRVWFVPISFAVNYLFFIFCSILEFPLIVNWFLFAFLLFFETLFYSKGAGRCALFSTLIGIIYGLAVNIFCRSIIAILLNQPLQCFDNRTSSVGNLKGIPVLLGFVLAGAIMQVFKRPAFIDRLRLILRFPRHHAFLLEMMAGLFFYLFLNLLLYSTPLNDLLLKVWSIKSCLFSVIGFYIAIRYTVRICELDDYREKNLRIEQELKEQKWEEEYLRRQAAIDSLTGLYDRQYAEETLSALMSQNTRFSLCFLDLDGLKNVNDQYGHEEGDRYILKAVREIHSVCRSSDSLFRYGGDEFLLLLADMGAEGAKVKAEAVNGRLHGLAEEGSFSYQLSFSYGVAESGEYSDCGAMIHAADHRMYEQKRQKCLARD